MDSREFAKSLEKQVADFCKALDAKLPAYSFIPLTTDEMRIKVMQSRLFNEIRAGEIFGGWLKSTPELERQENPRQCDPRGIRARRLPRRSAAQQRRHAV